jgi:PBP1b-binding outer membrane lipoprotein LpoB
MKRIVISILLFLVLFAGKLSAQDTIQAYTDSLNNIFQQVDKSKIATGLLIDYRLQSVDPKVFNVK